MKLPLKAFLFFVVIVALSLMGMLTCSIHRDQELFHGRQVDLENSRTIWETIAADKEALQEELIQAQNALKEARLTLEESRTRAETLRAEIETLEQDIAVLQEQTGSSSLE